VMLLGYARVFGTKVGFNIAAIVMVHIEKRPVNWFGIMEAGATPY
jgi:hypothetical protein